MLEVLLGNKPGIPPPSIWERLEDNTFYVDPSFAIAGAQGKVYFDKGNLFNVYDIATKLVSTTLKKRRPGTLAYPYGTLLSDPSGTKLYATGAAAPPYQPERLGSYTTYIVSSDTWSASIGGIYSTAATYFGSGVVAGIVGGLLIVVGGFLQDGTASLRTYLSDAVTDKGALTTTDRSNNPWNADFTPSCGAVLGGYFYVLSAYAGRFMRTTDGITWSSLTVPPKIGGGCKCVVYNNKIYFYGGYFGQTIHVYNPATNSWSTLQPGGPGNVSGLVIWGSKLYVFYATQVWTAELNPEPA